MCITPEMVKQVFRDVIKEDRERTTVVGVSCIGLNEMKVQRTLQLVTVVEKSTDLLRSTRERPRNHFNGRKGSRNLIGRRRSYRGWGDLGSSRVGAGC